MPRRYFRRRIGNRDKYSIEQTNILTPSSSDWPAVPVAEGDSAHQKSYQYAIPVVPPDASQGMRKVKHLTFSISNNMPEGENGSLFYTIAFVPEGYEPQPIQYPASGYAVNNYDANQFVMSSGVLDFSGGPLRIRCPLSRNLNSGDRIYIILATNLPDNMKHYTAQVQYAITNQ